MVHDLSLAFLEEDFAAHSRICLEMTRTSLSDLWILNMESLNCSMVSGQFDLMQNLYGFTHLLVSLRYV